MVIPTTDKYIPTKHELLSLFNRLLKRNPLLKIVTTSCIEFNGLRNDDGYGKMSFTNLGNKRFSHISSHRASYICFIGKIPKNTHVLHKCDNPPCINPSHLYLGNQKDNMSDMVDKGRSYVPSGQKNPKCKLTDDKIIKIRKLSNKFNTLEISKMFGVSRSNIYKIINRQLWRHVK